VHLKVEPLPRGAQFEFVNEIKGRRDPRQYIPAVEKGVVAGMERGPLAGLSRRRRARRRVLRQVPRRRLLGNGVQDRRRDVLPPGRAQGDADPARAYQELVVRVPEEFLGDVMGDMSSRRGKILGTEADGHYQVIRAKAPAAELYKYATHLRSITQGRGMHGAKFSHYEEVAASRRQGDRDGEGREGGGRRARLGGPNPCRHSSGATIKRKKAVTDAVRGKMFTKLHQGDLDRGPLGRR